MNIKQVLHAYGKGWAWHGAHALAVLLLVLLLLERFVPGAVLGHTPLFLAIPLLLLCLTVHPLAEAPARPWLLIDLWAIVFLCLGRIGFELVGGNALAWLLAGFAAMLTVAFLWIFSRSSVDSV